MNAFGGRVWQCPHHDCGYGECSGRTLEGGWCETHGNGEGRCQKVGMVNEHAPDLGDMVAEGWTPMNADAHLNGSCDRSICTGHHAQRMGYVVNNITGARASQDFEVESANRLCGELNRQAGPGGLYGVKEFDENRLMLVCNCGEAFDSLAEAFNHQDPEDDHESFTIQRESEAM